MKFKGFSVLEKLKSNSRNFHESMIPDKAMGES